MHIAQMTREHAVHVATWRYPPPYDSNDMTGADPDFLADPSSGFHALMQANELIGFRSFGPDGQVPGGPYDDAALDTGGGLRPDLTGRGLGRQAISTGLEFGMATYSPAVFRLTIAAYNVRAHRVVEALGFVRTAEFTAEGTGRVSGWPFILFAAPVTALVLHGGGSETTKEESPVGTSGRKSLPN
jgi:RimJ/RimL family protein N-acetyltransferase